MDFKQILKKERTRLDKENMEKEIRAEISFRKRVEALEPMLERLNNGMNQIDLPLKFFIHTDKRHFPCPAIHIEKGNKFRHSLYHDFGEIYIKKSGAYYEHKTLEKDIWVMGACNMHNNRAETDEELIEFVIKTIADKCYKRKSLVS